MQLMIQEVFKVNTYICIFVPIFQTNLTLDWDYSAGEYTCYSYNKRYLPNPRIKPILECENIPKYYSVSDFGT
jgi:hypothetical protein